MAGSTVPGVALDEERARILAVKRAKRWVSGCGAVEFVIPAARAAAVSVDVEEDVSEEAIEEVDCKRKAEADDASVGLCCLGCGDLLGERCCCCCCGCCCCCELEAGRFVAAICLMLSQFASMTCCSRGQSSIVVALM